MAIPGELIPLAGIAVAAIAVIGRVIVQPIVQALVKLNEPRRVEPAATAGLEQRLSALEEQQLRLERSLERVLQDRDFYLQL
ncbi:MAG: hypothetical protein FIB01_02535, partial [Gemmatimonadetes bacterium]|nr:hypothetical protein [Gemmatimonadota bacterium]